MESHSVPGTIVGTRGTVSKRTNLTPVMELTFEEEVENKQDE